MDIFTIKGYYYYIGCQQTGNWKFHYFRRAEKISGDVIRVPDWLIKILPIRFEILKMIVSMDGTNGYVKTIAYTKASPKKQLRYKKNVDKCIYCESKLVPIGKSRRKGAYHRDWLSRTSHKKCYKDNLI